MHNSFKDFPKMSSLDDEMQPAMQRKMQRLNSRILFLPEPIKKLYWLHEIIPKFNEDIMTISEYKIKAVYWSVHLKQGETHIDSRVSRVHTIDKSLRFAFDTKFWELRDPNELVNKNLRAFLQIGSWLRSALWKSKQSCCFLRVIGRVVWKAKVLFIPRLQSGSF